LESDRWSAAPGDFLPGISFAFLNSILSKKAGPRSGLFLEIFAREGFAILVTLDAEEVDVMSMAEVQGVRISSDSKRHMAVMVVVGAVTVVDDANMAETVTRRVDAGRVRVVVVSVVWVSVEKRVLVRVEREVDSDVEVAGGVAGRHGEEEPERQDSEGAVAMTCSSRGMVMGVVRRTVTRVMEVLIGVGVVEVERIVGEEDHSAQTMAGKGC